MLRRIHQQFVTVACFAAAIILLNRSLVGLPDPSDLERVEGTVSEVLILTRTSKYGQRKDPAIRLAERTEAFRYLEWFPQPEVILHAIKPGDHIAILSDTGKNGWIWQIEKDGGTVVDYTDVRKAVADNNRFDPLFAVVLLLLGALGWYRWMNNRGQTKPSTAAE